MSAKSESTPSKQTRRETTRAVASFAADSKFASLPENVKAEAARGFMNWLGCALGGCQEPAVGIAAAMMAETGGKPQASIIGHGQCTDVAGAAFVNCISSSILAFDDAHLPTVTHPTGPVASSLFALSETLATSGEDFLNAFAVGVEVTCRLSNVLLLPPSRFNLGFYVTGLTAPIGVAVAVGRLLKLDEQRMSWAIGLAASQSSGFRSTHGTMTAHFRPGHATRAGVWAALLAAKGFTSSEDALEAEKGFFDVFSAGADLGHAVDGLGQRYELLLNAYKPYPCGIVIHPTIDACLELRQQLSPASNLKRVSIRVHPMALSLTGIRTPTDTLECHISIFHWVAVSLLRGHAGLAETTQECIDDPQVSALRLLVDATPDPALKKGESIVEVTRSDGVVVREHVVNARGSIERPMSDTELNAKFREQSNLVLSAHATEDLLLASRGAAALSDVGREIAAILHK